MYGSYKPGFELRKKGLKLSLKKRDNFWEYRRKISGEEKTLFLVFSRGEILINPVEPVNLPQNICSNLFVEFATPLILAPKETLKVYITFPVEIGVVASFGRNYRVLDIFTFTKPKYTLYGNVRTGVICKYWKSEVFTRIPKVNPLEEGVMELSIYNSSNEWVDIREAVFNAYGMKIYYDKSLVSMKASMKVISEDVAETGFANAPLRAGMKKSVEIYLLKKIMPPFQERFVMEEGV